MKKIAFAIASILALCAIADANDCRRVVRVQAVHHAAVVQHVQHAVVTPVVAAVFAPVPVYSVGYSAAPDNSALVNEIRQLRQQVEQLQAQPQQQPQAIQQPKKAAALAEHPGVTAIKKNCAACHDGATAKGKGGGLVLLDRAGVAKLTDREMLDMARAVYSGRMPKGGKISDEDVGAIMAWIDTQK